MEKKVKVFRGSNRPGHHAGVDVIKKLLSFYRNGKKTRGTKHRKKCDLIIVRITKEGNLGSSKPCLHCLWYINNIHSFRIHNITYSNNKGVLVTETLKNMMKSMDKYHISYGNRISE